MSERRFLLGAELRPGGLSLLTARPKEGLLRELDSANYYVKLDLRSGREYPLNLSISISGGKETNRDCPSSGE
jgi:hypothetical protein